MSQHKKNAITAALAVIGTAALPASATPITITETISLNQLLSGNGTSVQFNIASALSSHGLGSSDVISGGLVVYGLSDPSYADASAQPYSEYQVTDTTSRNVTRWAYSSGYRSCSRWGGCYYYGGYSYSYTAVVNDTNEIRSRDILHEDNVADVMQVTAGGSSATDTVDQILNQTDPYGNATYDGSTGSYDYGYRYLYSQERDVYEAIYGELLVSMELDLLALQDIWADGILDFGVEALVGEFMFQDAELTFQVERQVSQNVNNVPEPGTLGLLGAGLAAGAMIRRRRTARKK